MIDCRARAGGHEVATLRLFDSERAFLGKVKQMSSMENA
jgi:hypothetical protein